MLSDSKKQQFSITLTEPVVFLRSSDPSGRLRPDPNDPPTLVRGILNLNVVKPIGISSIQVELTGVLEISPQEQIVSHRIELPEKQRIYSSAATVFRADQVPHGRRSASVGPGLFTPNSNDDDEHAVTTLPRPPSSPRRDSERRNSVSFPPDLGPTPPYTVAQFPTPIQSSLGTPVESPAQTLEELRQAPSNNPEGHVHLNGLALPSPRPYSSELSLPNSTTQLSASSASNDSLHRENDNHTDDMVHTSPPFEGDTSFHNTTEESPHIPPHHVLSPSCPSRVHSPGNTRGTQFRTRVNSRDSSNTPSGRSHLPLLSSVLDAVMEVASRVPSRPRDVAEEREERERGRTTVRFVGEEQSRASTFEVGEGVAGTGNGRQPRANSSHPSGYMEHREHHLLGLGRVFGLERDYGKEKDGDQKNKERGESWREFQPGTYRYPISFLLPPDLPPTFSVPYGSLNYVIKAVAHRPGTFVSKLSCRVPLIVVAAPATGVGEGGGDPGPLFVQREWAEKLAYSFGLSSRLFLLGSQRHLKTAVSEGIRGNTEPLVEAEVEARAGATYGTVILDITLLPLEKIKIWSLGVLVDQCIRYVDEQGRLFRDDKRQVRLLEVQDTCLAEEMDLVGEEQTHKNKHKNKDDFTQIPLLPTPISPHRSPLLGYLPPSTDPSILAGPGPYTLSTNIGLPGCNDPGHRGLHFTVKQKSSTMKVEHFLRIVVRVEWVGDEGTDNEVDRQRFFDIAVRTPITILSCRYDPEYQTLPRYSQFTEDSLQNPTACACRPSIVRPAEQLGHGHEVENHLGHVMTPDSTSSFESEDAAGHFHREAAEQRSGDGHSRASSRPRTGSGQPSPLTTPSHSRPPSPTSQTHEACWRGFSAHAHAQTHSHGHHHHSGSQSSPVSTAQVHAHSETSTPHPSHPPSPLVRYERLVSGLESDVGDAPPSYESIASSI